MDKIPPEILRRIPPLLDRSDVARLMRAGSRRLYAVCGECLYATVRFNLPASEAGPQHAPHIRRRFHPRVVLDLLADGGPRGALEHPARWVRHISFIWPMFPSDAYADTCALLARLLAQTAALRSLELRGPSPPAWPRLRADTLPPACAPRLVAIKTDDAGDVAALAHGRRLDAVFVTTWLDPGAHAALLHALHASAGLACLQLSLRAAGVAELAAAARTLAARFPRLLVLCVQFDLGPAWRERPLSWGTFNAAVAQLGAALRVLHHLRTLSVTIFPEPPPSPADNRRAIELLAEHCDTLRHVEVRWLRRDGDEYHEASFSNALLRGQWAYTP